MPAQLDWLTASTLTYSCSLSVEKRICCSLLLGYANIHFHLKWDNLAWLQPVWTFGSLFLATSDSAAAMSARTRDLSNYSCYHNKEKRWPNYTQVALNKNDLVEYRIVLRVVCLGTKCWMLERMLVKGMSITVIVSACVRVNVCECVAAHPALNKANNTRCCLLGRFQSLFGWRLIYN